MSVYSRYKREPEGFRNLVSLLESTPVSKRARMIEVGMQEDAEFTRRALQYLYTFEDLIQLPDLELAELIATAPIAITATAISPFPADVKARFLKNALPKIVGPLRDAMEREAPLREVGGAQLKLIEFARSLEKRGLIKTKAIP